MSNEDPNIRSQSAGEITAHDSKGKLLLVDDDTNFAEGFSRLLEKHGWSCLAAGDAACGLDVLKNNDVDALISDIHMPGDSGLGLIAKAREIRRGLPVFLCTGQPTWETAATSIGLSVSGYLSKPPALSEFLPQLERCVAVYRRFRSVALSRSHLQKWVDDLRAIEDSLMRDAHGADASRNFLRVTLQNVAVQLAELAGSTTLAADLDRTGEQVHNLALIAALQKTITVLEDTRKSFKSKELGELRKQLNQILNDIPPQRDAQK